jgi:polar amino acid transport system permease protein
MELGARVRFDYALVASKLPEIFHALGITLYTWILGLVGACALGFLVAVARRYGPRLLDLALGGYVELFRGTPFLIQLFLLYFGGPYAGLSLDAIPAGLLGLSVYGAAYFSEIFRGGFEAVPRGHVEAGECVGLSRAQIIGRILLPEMTMLVLPASVNMAIILMKETAVLSVVTVPELTLTISAIGTEFYAFVECLFLLALFYWGLTEICGWLGRIGEARLARFRFAAA